MMNNGEASPPRYRPGEGDGPVAAAGWQTLTNSGAGGSSAGLALVNLRMRARQELSILGRSSTVRAARLEARAP
jgi:hypothetical protein